LIVPQFLSKLPLRQALRASLEPSHTKAPEQFLPWRASAKPSHQENDSATVFSNGCGRKA
jgi:hypothetical protein